MTRERYQIHDLIVDVGAVRVARGDQTLSLPPLSFALLVALARRAPDVVTAETLIDDVWRGTAVADETLTQRVRLLRRSLGDDAARPHYVRSVRGHGYQLAAPALRLSDEGSPVAPGPGPGRRTIRKVYLVAASAALATITLIVGALSVLPRSPAPSSADALPVATTPVSVEELVLRADGYRARHLDDANELALELYGRALALAPNHAAALVGQSRALTQRATKFNRGVGHAKEATRIARQVLAREPDNAQAHHALALSLDARGQLSAALRSYDQALALDPSLVNSRASRAYALQSMGRLDEALRENLAVLESGAPDAHYLELQIGTTLALLGFPNTAEAWLERAHTLRPDNVFTAVGFARFRLAQGRWGDADRLAEAALERGILRAELSIIRGEVAVARGEDRAALRHFAQAQRVRPNDFAASIRQGALERRRSGHDTSRSRYDESVAALRSAHAEGSEWFGLFYDGVVLHTAFGNLDAAIASLDTAINLGFRDLGWLRHDPWLAELRDHPPWVQRLDQLEQLLATARQRVREADWLPPALLAPDESGR